MTQMSPTEAAAMLRHYYEQYNSEDPEAMRGLLADNVVLESAAGRIEGVDAYIDMYRYMIGTFVDQMTPDAISVEGDEITAEITDVLTAREDVGDFMGASLRKGERMTLQLTGCYRITDGRIAHIQISPRGGE